MRGHSNVQGQRTVGMTEKPELAPLDKLKELYEFEPPREKGLNTVEACEGIIKGEVKAFIGSAAISSARFLTRTSWKMRGENCGYRCKSQRS